MSISKSKVRAAVFGAAAGDAVGVPYEFSSAERMRKNPATDMTGGGTYSMPAGTWSDDTTMILCTLDKLDEDMDFDAIMKAFLSWVYEGEYTPFGDCFDIGNTTRTALMNYARHGDVNSCGIDSSYNNGNGSLMRIIPAALYASAHGLSDEDAVRLSHRLSTLTHAHIISQTGCGIFTFIAMSLIRKADKSSVSEGLKKAAAFYSGVGYGEGSSVYSRLFSDDFAKLPEAKISSSGYVVTTLECAVWCLLHTDNYHDCVLKAVNFGGDTDTAACVAGALAGLLYGLAGIPVRWTAMLVKAESIEAVISGFCERNGIIE